MQDTGEKYHIFRSKNPESEVWRGTLEETWLIDVQTFFRKYSCFKVCTSVSPVCTRLPLSKVARSREDFFRLLHRAVFYAAFQKLHAVFVIPACSF